MIGQFNNIKIQGICSAVPPIIEYNEMYARILGDRRVKKQIKLTGVSQRHISHPSQKPSDLCFAAASRMLDHLKWDKNEIKVLIFITQRPDFKLPSTAFFLQKRLGLSKECICYDINLGCSSFVVGMQTVSSLLQSCNTHEKALLLVGDTSSFVKSHDVFYTPDEITHDMLFGSEGTCVAVEKVENSNLMFMNMSDGEGYEAILGELNEPTHMKGDEVFSFAINDVTKTVTDFKRIFSISENDIDYYVFHQAQKLILDTIIETCNIDPQKELRSLEEYGNTSGGSVPLTVNANVDKFKDKERVKLLLCGFGVGLSWGCVYTEIDTENILPVIECDEYYRSMHDRPEFYRERLLRDKTILVSDADTDLGEWISKYYKTRGAKLILCGKNMQALERINRENDDDNKILVIDETNNIYNRLKEFEVVPDGILVFDNFDVSAFCSYCESLEETEEECSLPKLVICKGYLSTQDLFEKEEEIKNIFAETNKIEGATANGVMYNAGNVEISQIHDSGQKWVEDFINAGCPDSFVKASYIANNTLHLFADGARYTRDSIIKMN